MMFVLGCFAEERMVPVGVSFPHRGMRNNHHDAVGAQLMIPIGRTCPGGARPAAGGACQPATAAWRASGAAMPQPKAGRPAADQASQPAAEAEGEADAQSPSGCWCTDTFENENAEMIYERLRWAEETGRFPEHIQRELGKMLFKKTTVTTGGVERQYVAGRAETIRCIKKLLKRRLDYMEAMGLLDSDDMMKVHLAGYIFDEDDEEDVMKLWKDSAVNGEGFQGKWCSEGDL